MDEITRNRLEGKVDAQAEKSSGMELRLNKLELGSIEKSDLSNLRGEIYAHVEKGRDKHEAHVMDRVTEKLGSERQALMSEMDKLGVEMKTVVQDSVKAAFKDFVDGQMVQIIQDHMHALEERRRNARNEAVVRWRNRVLLLTAILTAVFTAWQWVEANNEVSRLKDAAGAARTLDRALNK